MAESPERKGTSFTCLVPRVAVSAREDRFSVTLQDLEESDLLLILSGAIAAFNRLINQKARKDKVV